MKKLLIVAVLTLIFSPSLAQRPSVSMKNFNTWSATANFGTGYTFSDLRDTKSQFNLTQVQPILGITLAKQISHFLSLEGAYTGGTLALSGEDGGFTTNFSQIEGRIRFNVTNGQIIPKYRNTQLYAYLGLGMLYYDVQNDSLLKLNQDWVHVIPIGVGAKHRITDRVSINLDLAYNRVNTDNLDGINAKGSKNDSYLRGAVGFQYTFGKKKNLEWDIYTEYYRPLDEHSVDTVFVVKRSIDTLVVKLMNDAKPTAAPVESNTVYFDFNRWNLKNKYFDSLDDLALKLLNGDISSVVIEGHADANGTESANLRISQRRAEAVQQYLISKGVNPRKITLTLFGSIQPASTDPNKNRRVEIKEK